MTSSNPLSQIALLGEAIMIEFIDDTIYFLKGNKVAFLTKYYAAFGNESKGIVRARDFLQDIIQLALRKTSSGSNLDTFKDSVQHYISVYSDRLQLESCPLEAKQVELIAVAIFTRRDELA